MTVFRTRRLQAGDEYEFNEVFNRFIGNRRVGPPWSLDNMRWIWHQAPGGPADSWIIETQDRSGWKIVGHHALCPVRFTLGEEDWLCAKTMKTFLLPEYRDKFLYLRFEKECLREADARFDATYSLAPGTARMRSALGYHAYSEYIEFERGFHPMQLIYRTMGYLAGRYSFRARCSLLQRLAAISEADTPPSSIEFTEYTAAEAASSRFFADYWTEARQDAGMAPRRDCADLEWRFWKRPGFKGATLTHTWPQGGRAYCIVDTTSNPLLCSLVDFSLTPANPQLLESLLDALFAWSAQQGALALKFRTLMRGLPPQLMDVFLRKMKPFAARRFIPAVDMPRRFSPLGYKRMNGMLPDWNTTEFLMLDGA